MGLRDVIGKTKHCSVWTQHPMEKEESNIVISFPSNLKIGNSPERLIPISVKRPHLKRQFYSIYSTKSACYCYEIEANLNFTDSIK